MYKAKMDDAPMKDLAGKEIRIEHISSERLNNLNEIYGAKVTLRYI